MIREWQCYLIRRKREFEGWLVGEITAKPRTERSDWTGW